MRGTIKVHTSEAHALAITVMKLSPFEGILVGVDFKMDNTSVHPVVDSTRVKVRSHYVRLRVRLRVRISLRVRTTVTF